MIAQFHRNGRDLLEREPVGGIAGHRVAGKGWSIGIAGGVGIGLGERFGGRIAMAAATGEDATQCAVPKDHTLHRWRGQKGAQELIFHLGKRRAAPTDLAISPKCLRTPVTIPVAIQVDLVAIETTWPGVWPHFVNGKAPWVANDQQLSIWISARDNIEGNRKRDHFGMLGKVINRRIGQQDRIPLVPSMDTADKGHPMRAMAKLVDFNRLLLR